jgi:hypothetical protein
MQIAFDYQKDGQVTCTNRQGLQFYLLGQPSKLSATFVPGTSLTPTSHVDNRERTAGAR